MKALFKLSMGCSLLALCTLGLLGADCQDRRLIDCTSDADCPTGISCFFENPCDRWEIDFGGDDDDSAAECPHVDAPVEVGTCRTDAWSDANDE